MIFFFLGTYPDEFLISRNKQYESLIASMAEGEVQALEELYVQTKSAVYGFSLSILRNRQDAEDVMQDAYVRFFSAAKTYRSQGKPMAWMFTIVRNLALTKLRNHKAVSSDEVYGNSEDFSSNKMDRIVLHAAMEHLSNEERQIIILYSVTGLKHREVSEILQLPLSTVLSKYHRALSKLRKILEEEKL